MEKIPIGAIIFCSGYRRTGKDTLYHNLCDGNSLNWNSPSSTTRWFLEILQDNVYSKKKRLLRGAFADILKEEIFELYGIQITEENKDNLVLPGKTGRDICITVAAERRKVCPTYFADKLFGKYCADVESANILFLTDWRYLNEFERANLLFPEIPKSTMRLTRSSIEIPQDSSEHQLDNFQFDHMLYSD